MSTRNRNAARRRAQRTQSNQNAMVGMSNSNSLASIPRNYPAVAGDSTRVRFRCMTEVTAREDSFSNVAPKFGRRLIVLGKGTSSPDYLFLSSASAGFAAMANVFSRFAIVRLKAEITNLTGDSTGGGIALLNYEPTNSGVANPPVLVGDVASSVHSVTAGSQKSSSFVVNPSSYFADWRTLGDATGDGQAGVLQVLVRADGLTTDSVVGLVTMELDIVFAGFRTTT